MDFKSSILQAEQLKADGTALFKQGDYRGAVAKYSKMFAYLNGFDLPRGMPCHIPGVAELNEEQSKKLKELQLQANVNSAVCYSKLNEYELAVKSASRALAIDPKHPKALFHRAHCNIVLGALDEAEHDLSVAAAINNDPAIQREVQLLKQKQVVANAKAAQREKAQFAGMFAKMDLGA